MIDGDGTEIRITCFNETAKLHHQSVQVGASYFISKALFKEENTRYNKLNSRLEINLDQGSILKCCDDRIVPPNKVSNFTPISEIANYSNYTLVSIIGILVDIGNTAVFQRKYATQVMRRTLKINDISNFSIDVNLWGDVWQTIGDDLQKKHCSGELIIISIINGYVGYFNGKVISSIGGIVLNVNPSIPEAQPLIARGELTSHVVLFPSTPGQLNTPYTRKTLAFVLEQCTILTDVVETVIRETIQFIKPNAFCYPACPLTVYGKECKKKCIQQKTNEWFCPRCQEKVPKCTYRYVLQVKIYDHTDNMWVTIFDEVASKILQISTK
ncbi:replication protein A 70 kDa DNA-binding subunit A-like [Cryptomeria japonica]|uniref:replication protein A 70 kDa DNA-binding subunit A-like n=1 Tax=Cryptomeria japonica TaxID=3369 RepID=UPI0027DA1397|nr:replication protein A 70 kDa DNA-binding subunit A-like [Cryptomeria japonica]